MNWYILHVQTKFAPFQLILIKMIAVISPAKTLDFDCHTNGKPTTPRLLGNTMELMSVLREKPAEELQSLMSISHNLALLNARRYRDFKKTHSLKNSKQCAMAFKGDVYLGLEAHDFTEDEMDYAQSHLRILSGLYGLLRPKDLIQPYRLEMGTSLAFDDYTTLYNYWDDKITSLLLKDLKKQGEDTIINLASNEYFKAIKRRDCKAKIIDIEFKDFKNGDYKVISFFAKKARGLMSRYMIKNRLQSVEELKSFDYDGYYFDNKTSKKDQLCFKRG